MDSACEAQLMIACGCKRLYVKVLIRNGMLVVTGVGVDSGRICVSATYRPGERALWRALDEGVTSFFGFPIDTQFNAFARGLRANQREKVALATGGANWVVGHVPLRRALERALRRLGTDYLDTFYYLGLLRAEHFPARIEEELCALRETGLVRAVGVSLHSAALAAQLVERPRGVDVLMVRYNAARRELEGLGSGGPRALGFTATYWGRLLRRATAEQCYRFVMTNPRMNGVFTSPRSEAEVVANVRAVERGGLAADEAEWMRRTGDEVRARSPWFLD